MSGNQDVIIVRHKDLQPLAAHPADRKLARYHRDRFSVIGRPKERDKNVPGAQADIGINFGYLRCAPGKGNCSHRHPQWEVFLPLTGKWNILVEGGELDGPETFEVGPWDMIIFPPETFHEATNISDEDGWMLSLNPGTEGAPYTIHPKVIEELRVHSAEAALAAADGTDI